MPRQKRKSGHPVPEVETTRMTVEVPEVRRPPQMRVSELRAALCAVGSPAPSWVKKSTLVSLYQRKVLNRLGSTGVMDAGNTASDVLSTRAVPAMNSATSSVVVEETRTAVCESAVPDPAGNGRAMLAHAQEQDTLSKLVQTVETMQNAILALSSRLPTTDVTAARVTEETTTSNRLTSTALSHVVSGPEIGSHVSGPEMCSTSGLFANTSTRGIPSDQLPFVELVSPQIRRDILSGKNINLATLLISGHKGESYEGLSSHLVLGDQTVPLKQIADIRLNRPLDILQFIEAFGIYKNIMCEAYPHCRMELDASERSIVEMSSRFGGNTFYDYHKMFSKRAETLLLSYSRKIDWSIRDNNLFCSLFAGRKAIVCANCASIEHNTGFCPEAQNQVSPSTRSRSGANRNYDRNNVNDRNTGNFDRNFDRRGRARVFDAQGKEMCNDFNSEGGCKRTTCLYTHACVSCKRSTHHAVRGKCVVAAPSQVPPSTG
jgi:hypothetical protein